MASLTRANICNAIETLLESDNTLYGSSAYINYITDDIVKYEAAKVGVDKPYKMFLKAPRREKLSVRMSNNVDYAVTIEYRVEGLQSNPQTSWEQLDKIDERIEHDCDNQMWEGLNLSTCFTNSESTVVNIEWEGSTCDIRKDEGGYKVECEGTIRIEINRVKP